MGAGFADDVTKCYHPLALDERRRAFHLNRLNARVEDAEAEGRLFEVLFRGVRSDVGGGDDDPELSSIALNWICRKRSCVKCAGRPRPRSPRTLRG